MSIRPLGFGPASFTSCVNESAVAFSTSFVFFRTATVRSTSREAALFPETGEMDMVLESAAGTGS